MIKADAKTGIIAKMGDNIVLLSDVAMIGYVLKETSPEGIYTAFKDAFVIGMESKDEEEMAKRLIEEVLKAPLVKEASRKKAEKSIEAIIEALMEEIGVDEDDGE